MDTRKLVKTIFDFSNADGFNVLMALFDMNVRYANQTGNAPDSSLPMFNEIESIAFFLIEMAEDNELDMNRVLNWTANDGQTLFSIATQFSETLARELLKRNVVVTTVDNLFQIPSFRVS